MAKSSRKQRKLTVLDPFPSVQNRPQGVEVSKSGVTTVVNNGTSCTTLLAVGLNRQKPVNSFSLGNSSSCESITGPWTLGASSQISFDVLCRAQCLGLHEAEIVFEFEKQDPIILFTSLLCDDHISATLRPDKPFCRPKKLKRPPPTSIEPGDRLKPPPYTNWLSHYRCPLDLQKMFEKCQVPKLLSEELSEKNYVKVYSTLLWAEEFQLQNDMQQYGMQGIHLRTSEDHLVLANPGFSEKRPSLSYGNALYARPSNIHGKENQGFVLDVKHNEAHLKFSKTFHRSFQADQLYDIRFSLNRVGMRRYHQAIEFAKNLLTLYCFPTFTEHHEQVAATRPVRKFYQKLNKEQENAVTEILNKKGAPAYIIFGPPGTGKTRTVVEAILQVRRNQSKAVILACATTNSSSDLLMKKLSPFIPASEMLKLNAFHRKVPTDIQAFSHFKAGECPTVEQLKPYKIILCTYTHSSILRAINLPTEYFTHIFLDEAAQASEPESLIPIATLVESKRQAVVVLAGDYQQLGPVIKSSLALKHGLSRSLMERLIISPPYECTSKKGLVTKLVRNYRSHPRILRLPSKLFYAGELIPCAGTAAPSLCDWSVLPNKAFPFLFVNVNGCNERQGNSPSWFNPQEAAVVVQLVESLKSQKSIKSRDIGIITPYRQQANKITKALSSKLGAIKVGSVEEFQGAEKLAIFISTVRTCTMSQEQQQPKAERLLGFLGNPKRLNVAITRAAALLVVVGNAEVLRQDASWKQVLDYCAENGSTL